MIARHEKNRDVRAGMIAERLRQSFPEVLARGRVVEQVSRAQHRIDAVSAADVEDPRDHLHPRARQLLLRLLGKGRKPPPEMPIGRVQDLQHDVSGVRRYPKRHLEEACHFWCPVPQVVVFVSPFPVDLVFPRIQRIDPALERLVFVRQPKNLGFDPIPGGRADDLVAPLLRRPQLLREARAFPAAHQNLVVDEPFELADGLLEVLLLALLDLPLIDEHRLVQRIVDDSVRPRPDP